METEYLVSEKRQISFIAPDDIDLGITVYDAPKSNILLGLDLQGGTRVVLQPDEKLSKEDMETLVDNLEERINLLGLSDVIIKSAQDLSGSQFIVIEIAGANEKDVENILAKQGKFEAKIGNKTVFKGGKEVDGLAGDVDRKKLKNFVGDFV